MRCEREGVDGAHCTLLGTVCVWVGGWGVGRYGCVWMCAWVFTIRSTLHTTRARHSACVCLGVWLWVCVCMWVWVFAIPNCVSVL